jgi:DNA-binding response OmpR family regulator
MNGYGKRVLLADNDEEIRLLLCLLLERNGYSVHAAADGEEALDEMMKRRFDAILTDVEMPRTTGFEVLTFCRVNFPQVPVILMSATSKEEFSNPALEQGAWAYIEKPFDSDELLRILRLACRTTREEGTEDEEPQVSAFIRLPS